MSAALSTAASPATERLSAREPRAAWPAAAAVGPGVIELMGGRRLIPTPPHSRAEIHATLVRGLPYAVLVHLVGELSALGLDEVAGVLGLSARTLRRHQDQPDKPMPPDLASKAWQLAEVLAQADAVFGGREAAVRWLGRPAMGLDGARPVALLRTLQGTELVTEFLGRLEHGVYN